MLPEAFGRSKSHKTVWGAALGGAVGHRQPVSKRAGTPNGCRVWGIRTGLPQAYPLRHPSCMREPFHPVNSGAGFIICKHFRPIVAFPAWTRPRVLLSGNSRLPAVIAELLQPHGLGWWAVECFAFRQRSMNGAWADRRRPVRDGITRWPVEPYDWPANTASRSVFNRRQAARRLRFSGRHRVCIVSGTIVGFGESLSGERHCQSAIDSSKAGATG